MLSSIPISRAAIRESVARSLKAWMFEARAASRAVGKGALDAMEARGRRWSARKRKEPALTLSKINGPVELGVSERHECEFWLTHNSNALSMLIRHRPQSTLSKMILYASISSRFINAFTYTTPWMPEKSCNWDINLTVVYVSILTRCQRRLDPDLYATWAGTSVSPSIGLSVIVTLLSDCPRIALRGDCRLLPHRVARSAHYKQLSLRARRRGSVGRHVQASGQDRR